MSLFVRGASFETVSRRSERQRATLQASTILGVFTLLTAYSSSLGSMKSIVSASVTLRNGGCFGVVPRHRDVAVMGIIWGDSCNARLRNVAQMFLAR
ncbi:hypothetical protein DSL72_004169 [Monilinia vaccinii-corymbosi]|uniref:Uncharacterized protein n=1 Tax=Monilinia vaccinii-corymbosi TaxID=61207 RepID=A0A8A3NVX6_9HELO|nr:hypothetical protein DSL72_004169 [Monilinia vaccinii-corymbosi]